MARGDQLAADGSGLPGGVGRLLACDRLAELAEADLQADRRGRRHRRRPAYDLRHAFASLLIHEGRKSIVEIAEQLGHNPTVCLDTYGHVMRELAGAERVSAEEQIVLAREALGREQGAQLTLL